MTLRTARISILVLIVLEVLILMLGPQPEDHLSDIREALEANKKPDWWDDAALGVHYAAWINLGILVTALFTAKWWIFSSDSKTRSESNLAEKSTRSLPRYFWPLLLVAVVVSTGVRLPLASKSLWWDESWSLMQASHGRWRPDPKQPEQFRFQEHDWKRAAWYYQKPTNHAPMSLAQKLSENTWRKLTGAERSEFSDLAARAPGLLASGLAVVFMGWLLWLWGRPGAAIAAAFLLALHPWLVRYGIDARGYAFVIPLSLAALISATRILQTRGESLWPWVGFAVTEFLWLWSWPYAAFDLVVLNGVLMALLLPAVEKGGRLRVFYRILLANALAAVCFLQMFLPNVMQMLRWLGQETISQPFSLPLAKSFVSQLIFGMEHSWPPGPEGVGLLATHTGVPPWGYTLSILTPLSVVVMALAWLAKKDFGALGKSPWLLLAVPVLGSGMFIAMSLVTGAYFYPRFVIGSAPVLIAAVCLLFYQNRRSSKTAAKGLWNPRWVLACMLLAMIMPFWIGQLDIYMKRPYAPLRDVTEYLKKEANSQTPTPIVACFGHGREIMPLYDAQIRLLENLEQLQAVIDEAKRDQRPLYVVYGHPIFNKGNYPEAIALLSDSSRFTEVKGFPAIDCEFYYRVLKAL